MVETDKNKNLDIDKDEDMDNKGEGERERQLTGLFVLEVFTALANGKNVEG